MPKSLKSLTILLTIFGLEAEEQLLGWIIHNPNRLVEIIHKLTPDNFCIEPHRLIWECLQSMTEQSQAINQATLLDELLKHKSKEPFDPQLAINHIITCDPDNPTPEEYVKIILRSAEQRKYARLGLRIFALATQQYAQEGRLAEYVSGQIQSALTELQPPPKTVTSFSANELCKIPFTAPRWLLDKLFVHGGVNLLAGEVSSGKTFLALDLALAVATNSRAWDGRSVTNGNVLYYCLDSSPRTMQDRILAMCAGRKINPPENLHIDFSPFNLSIPSTLAKLQTTFKRTQPALVIYDVLARYIPGVDENTVADIGPVMTGMRTLANQSGCSILLLHHFNKGLGYSPNAGYGVRVRGSTDIMAAVDTAVTVTVSGARAEPRRTLTPEKNREMPEEPPMDFRILSGENGGLVLEFTKSKPALNQATRAGEVLESTLGILQQASGKTMTRLEIVGQLNTTYKNDRLFTNKTVLDHVFSELARMEKVRVVTEGKFKTYGWAG